MSTRNHARGVLSQRAIKRLSEFQFLYGILLDKLGIEWSALSKLLKKRVEGGTRFEFATALEN